MIRRIAVGIWRLVLRLQYRRLDIIIGRGVEFNRTSRFDRFSRVCNGVVCRGTDIGSYSYVGPGCKLSDVKIGRFCSLGENICVVNSTHPTEEYVSTSPVFY